MQFSFTAALVALVATSTFAYEESYQQAPPKDTSEVIASSTPAYAHKHGPHTPPASKPESTIPASSSDVMTPSYTHPTPSSSSSLPVSSSEVKTPSSFTRATDTTIRSSVKSSASVPRASKISTPVSVPSYIMPKQSTPAVPKNSNSTSTGHITKTKYKTVVSTVHACPPGVRNCPYSKTTSLISTGIETVPTSAPATSIPVHSAPSGSSPPYQYHNTTAPVYSNTTTKATSTSHVTTNSDTTVTLTMTRPGSSSSTSEIPNSSSPVDTRSYKITSTRYHSVTIYPAATPVTGPNAYHPKSEQEKVPSSYGPPPTSPTGYDTTASPTGSSIPGESKGAGKGSSVPGESSGAGGKVPSSFGPGPASPTGYDSTAVPGASVPAAGETCEAPRTVTKTQRGVVTVTETAPVTVTQTLPPKTVTVTATSTETVNTEGPIQSSKKPHYPTKPAGPGASVPVGTGSAPVGTAPIGTGSPVPVSSRRTRTSTQTRTQTITLTQTHTSTSSINTPGTPGTPVPTPIVPTPVAAPSGSAVPGQRSSSKLSQYIPLPAETNEPPAYHYEPAMPTVGQT